MIEHWSDYIAIYYIIMTPVAWGLIYAAIKRGMKDDE